MVNIIIWIVSDVMLIIFDHRFADGKAFLLSSRKLWQSDNHGFSAKCKSVRRMIFPCMFNSYSSRFPRHKRQNQKIWPNQLLIGLWSAWSSMPLQPARRRVIGTLRPTLTLLFTEHQNPR